MAASGPGLTGRKGYRRRSPLMQTLWTVTLLLTVTLEGQASNRCKVD